MTKSDDDVPRIGADPVETDGELVDLGLEDRLTLRGRTAIRMWLSTLNDSARAGLSDNDCSALLDLFVEMAANPDDVTLRCLAREVWPLGMRLEVPLD